MAEDASFMRWLGAVGKAGRERRERGTLGLIVPSILGRVGRQGHSPQLDPQPDQPDRIKKIRHRQSVGDRVGRGLSASLGVEDIEVYVDVALGIPPWGLGAVGGDSVPHLWNGKVGNA